MTPMESAMFDTWVDQVSSKLEDEGREYSLQRWLEGYSLPPIDSYTEGHEWLLKAIDNRPALRAQISPLTAHLLHSYSRQELKSKALNRLVLNLFYLGAGLRDPIELWGPLLEVFENKGLWRDDALKYNGISLVAALRAALIENQLDDTFISVWEEMLKGKPHETLRGTPMSGFEGIVGLPKGPREVRIGCAFGCMSEYLDKSPFREEQMQQLIDGVKARFPKHPWDFEYLAARCEWQREWAKRLVGDPDPTKMIAIEYADINDPEDINDKNSKPRIRIRLPLRYRVEAHNLEPVIRQHTLEFYKQPPLSGTLKLLIKHHLLPVERDVSLERRPSGFRPSIDLGDSKKVVASLCKNERRKIA